ncbi:hypothetical protein FHT86_000767 [Rhizobium sp. BK313]|jgi:hypothetical protein|uniref:hypothetical protein n=1 Tax=Rhizobium sp. BK313 TaxID=2587081 RepID=UPI00105F49EF|nr:hypothetical protein [Rhizobium sp. BK313]MBB3452511.1 hypothetical protein [Rhizobium sp. BK313]
MANTLPATVVTVYEGQEWSGLHDHWAPIGGFFPAAVAIAVTSRGPGNLDDRWRNIGGVFPAGHKATAIARAGNNLDLFICGGDGRIYTSWWQS